MENVKINNHLKYQFWEKCLDFTLEATYIANYEHIPIKRDCMAVAAQDYDVDAEAMTSKIQSVK